jgi:hypothetical protein
VSSQRILHGGRNGVGGKGTCNRRSVPPLINGTHTHTRDHPPKHPPPDVQPAFKTQSGYHIRDDQVPKFPLLISHSREPINILRFGNSNTSNSAAHPWIGGIANTKVSAGLVHTRCGYRKPDLNGTLYRKIEKLTENLSYLCDIRGTSIP